MAKFLAEAAFAPGSAEGLQLLPLRFERLGADRYLVANLVGDGLLLSADELNRVTSLNVVAGDGLYERAFCQTSDRPQGSALAAPASGAPAAEPHGVSSRTATPLHLFVVTLRCEHSCPYCQVSRRSADRDRYDMNEDTAMRALDIALSAPTPAIKIEFQGGEPLLNFDADPNDCRGSENAAAR